MKKIILTIALTGVTAFAFSQIKKDTAQQKPQYSYFINLPVHDYRKLLNTLHNYKDELIYNPLMKAEEKIYTQASIDAYLKNISERTKIDSVLIKK